MGVSFIYLKLEIKRACKILPYFLAGAIVLALLLGTVAFSASKVLYGKSAAGRISVGVVLPEDDAVADKAVSMISSLDSVKSLCDFKYLGEEEGRRSLKEGKIYALMMIPEGFVRDIMNGVNTPVTILIPKDAGVEAMLFKELADAGARSLSVAQAAIYAGNEFCVLNAMADSIPRLESELNQIYLKYALPREDYFRSYQVSASGDISMLSYYGIALSVLFLLLCGIPASSVLRPDSLVFKRKLRMIGLGRWKVTAVKLSAVFVLLGTVGALLLAGAWASGAVELHWLVVVMTALLCLCVSAMVLFAYELAGSPTAGVMFLFLSATAMMFISGGFIPSVFLPEGIKNLAAFMPTTVLIRVLKGFITGAVSWEAVGLMCMMGAVFYLAAVWVGGVNE